jgi:hypothetical protein
MQINSQTQFKICAPCHENQYTVTGSAIAQNKGCGRSVRTSQHSSDNQLQTSTTLDVKKCLN